jgi:hypothetical protein
MLARRPGFPTALFALLACLLLALGCEKRSQPALDGEETAGVERQSGAGLFPIRQDSLWGFIDRTGEVAIAPQFDRAWRFSEGRALIRDGRRYGFIDTTGAVVVAPQFADAWHFSDGVAPVQTDSLWGFIDRSGEIVVAPQFDLAPGVVEEGPPGDAAFRRAQVDGQYGYRNEDGELVIQPRFDQAWTFSGGLARVRKDGRWGFINRRGEVVIDPQFAQAWDFRQGLARVQTPDGRIAYVDTTGAVVWPSGP